MMQTLAKALSCRKAGASGLVLAAALGLTLAGCKGGSGGDSVSSVALPLDYTLDLYCPDVGINTETCVLNDPNNPYARSEINAVTKFELYNTSPSAKSDFYIWATALALSTTGENQYYTALSLHDLFTQGGSENAREQAKRAYRSLLDNFFDSVTVILAGPPLDLIPDKDFFYSDFGSGSAAAGWDGNYTEDADFSPVWYVPAGTGYGAPTALIAFFDFTAGFASPYQNLVFKIKDLPTDSVWVLFSGGGADLELQLDLAAYATDIPGTTGWKQVEIPLSLFPNLPSYTAFAIQGGFANGGTFLLTDVGFTGDAIGGGLVNDVDGNGVVYLYRSGGEEEQDLPLSPLVGANLYDPESRNLLQLFVNQADAMNTLMEWGYEYDPVTETVSRLP